MMRNNVNSTSPEQSSYDPYEQNPDESMQDDASTVSPQSTTTSRSAANRPVGIGGGKQITRNRASYSCHTCRRRKVKCDKVHPICGNCMKNGTECVYDTAAPKKDDRAQHRDRDSSQHGVKRRREMSRQVDSDMEEAQSSVGELKDFASVHGAAGFAPPPRRGSQAIEARLDKLTNMIEKLSKANGSLSVEEMNRQLRTIHQDVESRNASNNGNNSHGDGTASQSRPSTPKRTTDSSGDEFPVPSGNATDLVDPIGSLNLGHLSLEDGGKSRYVGTTYWAYISDEINELNQLLRDQNRSHDVSPPDDGFNEGSIGDQMLRSPRRISVFSSAAGNNPRRAYRGDHFHRTILFPSGDSPVAHEKIVEADMLDNVPTKRQSDILYKGFMSGVHAISPVLHPPTVLRLYHSFWDWYDHSSYSGESCPDASFIPLLYAIWYGGSVTISIRTIKAEFHASTRSVLSEIYNEQVTRWLTKISFPRSPTLHGLAAFLIVQTILSKEEEPLTSSLFISLALRVAQTMGLHRDPAQFGIPACEAESRRRVWWHIVHMDGVVAMSSGLPPLVSDENYWDVRDTSEVKDTLLDTPQGEQYARLVAANLRPPDNPDDPTICGGPSMVNVYYLCARGKYTMARAIRRILKIQLGTKAITRRDMEELRSVLTELQFKLNSLVNRIPLAQHPGTPIRDAASTSSAPSDRSQSVGFSPSSTRSTDSTLPGDGPSGCPEQYHTPVLVAFHKWARILLSLFIDKAFCVAYQPFLKNAKSRVWPAARQGALRHCHGFMDKFIALATDPDFQPFQWSWPGNHQPMHATMIMLIDLYERPISPEAPRSRAYIDKIFSISGPDGGVVGGEDGITTQRPLKDGGREAWDMMRRLREKAWQRAGLNPEHFWTEQAQYQAGVAATSDEHRSATQSLFMDHYSPISQQSRLDGSRFESFERRFKPDPSLIDFSSRFYEMTRSHALPYTPTSALRQPQPRYSPQVPASMLTPPTPNATNPPRTSALPPYHASSQISHSPTVVTSRGIDASITGSNNTSAGIMAGSLEPNGASKMAQTTIQPSSRPAHPLVGNTAAAANAAPISTGSPIPFHLEPLSFPPSSPHTPQSQMQQYRGPDPTSPILNNTNALDAPTPPSMMDPSLHFDWDQWDAVFGQQIPVADEFMELDTVTGLGMAENATGQANSDLGMSYDTRMGGTPWSDYGRQS